MKLEGSIQQLLCFRIKIATIGQIFLAIGPCNHVIKKTLIPRKKVNDLMDSLSTGPQMQPSQLQVLNCA